MKRLFLCMERELVVVKEQYDNYETTYHLQNMQPTCIAVDPFRPNRVYCGTFGRGLWLSDDSGDSWRPIGDSYRYFDFPKEDGILHSSITSITISSNEQVNGYGVVYVGTEPSALFRSENGGETWTELKNMKSLLSSYTWAFPPRPFTHHVRWITVDPNNPNTIHVSIEAGAVIQSNDKGHTWIDKKFGAPIDAHQLLMHPEAPNRLYASCGDGFMGGPDRAYLESYNNGNSWISCSEGLEHHYLYSMAIDPADCDTILVSAAPSADLAHHRIPYESYIYRKTKDTPFQQVQQGLPSAIGTVISMFATNKVEPHTFYTLNNNGVFQSNDSGESWEQLNIPWKDEYKTQHPHALLVTSS
ncbi:glycosyl hydrolase [Bacillus cereus]|uniref:WD40/YVTN/BNR-like repeat-containing protein n=1 Tax=Bacillus cereus TaxID=1396 RepID=UPI000BF4CB0B|nr:glycosyl hydrolase [Bacillus cereus]MCU5023456.1 glycosyl hydrolase [Bacillus cereus]PEV13662.1 glycosyl hydrolase [Bacillus cereus]PGM70499.1 glycosyl hydrolase [Bacillus cereus]HDR8451750.1 glycosyl hydrolase [Bacillus cereus]HDR8464102.1 glycosyl hydrolase [Bacillus cereus]